MDFIANTCSQSCIKTHYTSNVAAVAAEKHMRSFSVSEHTEELSASVGLKHARQRLEVHQTRHQPLVLYLTLEVSRFHTRLIGTPETGSSDTRPWESLEQVRVEEALRASSLYRNICYPSAYKY